MIQKVWLRLLIFLMFCVAFVAAAPTLVATSAYDVQCPPSIAHEIYACDAAYGFDGIEMQPAGESRVNLSGPNALLAAFSEFLAAEGGATQLEFNFVNDLSAKPPIQWPANGGFAGDSASATLVPGTTVDRFGLTGGSYVSPTGTPFIQRSLAPGTQYAPYNIYTVLKPIGVDAGETAPAFGMPGGGMQYKLPSSVQSLIDSGHLGVGP